MCASAMLREQDMPSAPISSCPGHSPHKLDTALAMPLGKDRLSTPEAVDPECLTSKTGALPNAIPSPVLTLARYHWAFITGPKSESLNSQGSMHHVKNCLIRAGDPPIPQLVWEYQEVKVTMAPTPRLRIRVMIRKINDKQRLMSVLRNTPVRGEGSGWNCVEWLKEALEFVERDDVALRTSVTDWKTVRDAAMWYVEYKHGQGRFDECDGPKRAPTWDIVERRELIP